MILLGVTDRAKLLGQMLYACNRCGRETTFSVSAIRAWFTLYFIPLIPLGKRHEIRCNLCGVRFKAVDALERQISDWQKSGKFGGSECAAQAAR